MQPRRFGHHALAILGGAIVGSTVFSLIFTAMLGITMGDQLPGMMWLMTMTIAIWLGVFIVALPSAAIVLSLLWPVTRRGTVAANAICILAGATMGVVLAPLASPKMHGATLLQIAVFSATGAMIAAMYLTIAHRLGRDAYLATARPWM